MATEVCKLRRGLSRRLRLAAAIPIAVLVTGETAYALDLDSFGETTTSSAMHIDGQGIRFSGQREVTGVATFYETRVAQAEQSFLSGVTVGSTDWAFLAGRGDGHTRFDQTFGGDGSSFFHGGMNDNFEYQGAGVSAALTDTGAMQAGFTRITADDVGDRYAYFAGYAGDAWRAGFTHVERTGQSAAQGLNFGFQHRSLDFEFRQIETKTRASQRQLQLTHRVKRNRKLAVSFEWDRNPLYRDEEDSRVWFRFGGQWGRGASSSFSLDESGETDEESKPSSSKGALLGGLAVAALAVGLSGSSGSEAVDNAPRFNRQQGAARDVLNRINPTSVRENREYGGWVYRHGDGTYSSTNPVPGTAASVDIGPPTRVPSGTTTTASYHTHGGFDPRYDNENFSPQDILADVLSGVDGYLATPSGAFKYHQLSTGRIITLGTVAN